MASTLFDESFSEYWARAATGFLVDSWTEQYFMTSRFHFIRRRRLLKKILSKNPAWTPEGHMMAKLKS